MIRTLQCQALNKPSSFIHELQRRCAPALTILGAADAARDAGGPGPGWRVCRAGGRRQPPQRIRAEIGVGESMRWRPVTMTVAAVLGMAFLTGAGAATGSLAPAAAGAAADAAAQGGTWGTAAEIPGSN